MTDSHKPSTSISAFFPAFNDAATIASLVTAALEVLATCTDNYEVIVVNDGSTDGTRALVDSLARSHPHVRAIHHEANRGYGATLRTGFTHSTSELIFYTDGDGQYDPRELPRLLDQMADGIDVVNGYKVARADERIRLFLGAIYNWAAHVFFRIPISDVDCDFRLIRRSALAGIELESSSGAICIELISKLHRAGCTFRETPVQHYHRSHGTSQFFTPRSVVSTTIGFLTLWLKLVTWNWILGVVRRFVGHRSGGAHRSE